MKDPLTRREALGLLGAMALPWNELRAQVAPATPSSTPLLPSPPDPLPPDLANFHPIMEWIAQENAPRLSFLDERWRALADWKRVARPAFLGLLNYTPKVEPVRAELLRREQREGFTIEVLNLSATPAYTIPARVLVPQGRSGRLPAVVGMHCHSGRYTWGHEKIVSHPDDPTPLLELRQTNYGGRAWAEALARRGYVVLVSDAFYFGARRLQIEQLASTRVFAEVRDPFNAARAATPGSAEWIAATNRVCSFYEHHTAKTITATGATWTGIHVWDDMRTVDYLATRSDVDPQRIGAAGLSGGGLRTAHLIAADPRVKAAVVAGWMTVFAQQLRTHIRHTWMAWTPGLYRQLDLPDAAGLHAPGALLVQQCKRDQLYPLPAMEAAVDKLTRIYAKAGLPERFRGTFYDEPHSFKVPAQEEAFDWFDKWL